LNHAQKLGISYYDGEDKSAEQNSRGHENPDESYVVESSVQTQSSPVILMSHPVTIQTDEPLKTILIQHHENILVTTDSESMREPMRTDAAGGSPEKHAEDTDEDTVYKDQNEDSTS
jgi:hypothetical protein